LEYLRAELNIPVPKVFAWSTTCDNPVGCEYIIMEVAPGDALNTVWPTLEVDKKFAVIDGIISMQKRIVQFNTKLSGYGSLYFVKDAIAMGIPRRIPVFTAKDDARFCLGPLANRNFFHPALKLAGVDCGPCTSTSSAASTTC
jgi:hypothetical protein